MFSLKFSKILASVLLPCLALILISKLVNSIYARKFASRGFSVINLIEENSKISVATKSAPHQIQNNQQLTKDEIKKLIEVASHENGKIVAKKCMSCHSFEKNQPNKIGPNLFAIFGKRKASVPKYKYSASLISKGGIWNEESLFNFLQNPRKYIPGTKMVFPGISKQQDLANLIAFIKFNQDLDENSLDSK